MLARAPRITNPSGSPLVKETDPCLSSTTTRAFTRDTPSSFPEDVKEELCRFVHDALVAELQQLSKGVQRDIKEAFRWFAEEECGRVPRYAKGVPQGRRASMRQSVAIAEPDQTSLSQGTTGMVSSCSSWAPSPGSLGEKRATFSQQVQSQEALPMDAERGSNGGLMRGTWFQNGVRFACDDNSVHPMDGALRCTAKSIAGTRSHWQRSNGEDGSGSIATAERVKALNNKLKGKSYEMDQRFFARMNKQNTMANLTGRKRSSRHAVYGEHQVNFREYAAILVNSDCFDYFMGVLLFSYAILVGVQVDWEAQQSSLSTVPWYLRLLDLLFCAVFVAELSLRVYVHRRTFLRMEGWQWNAFDTVACFFAVLEEFTKLLSVSSLGGTWSVLRVIRIGRLLRVARIVHIIPELKQMMYLIVASMSCFLWTVVLMLVLIYCVGVFFTEGATDIKWRHADQDTGNVQNYWGSISTSILTLYMSISGGIDWEEGLKVFEADPLFVFYALVFCFYIAFATLVLLNLVTGVFVEGAQRIIKDEKDMELVKAAAKQFAMTDTDGSNELSFEELEHQLQNHGLDEYCTLIGINPAEMNKLFYILDEDHSGTVSVREFVKGCLHLRGPVKNADLASLTYNLKVVGIETNHRVANLEEMVQSLLESLSDPTGSSQDANIEHDGRHGIPPAKVPKAFPEGLPGTVIATTRDDDCDAESV